LSALLELSRISVVLGGTRILQDVDFRVQAGSVHCLLGDNGAGKTTLIQVIAGNYQPSSGTMKLDGVPAAFTSPRDALVAGIATVHQDAGTLPLMSVSRNFFLGYEPVRGVGPLRRIDFRKADTVALEQLRAMGITAVRDAKQLVGTMSGGERQALAISRALYFGARMLVLDEPTSALGVKEAAVVLKLISQARANGIAIVVITHNATHALAVGDEFTILIHGRVAAQFARHERTHEEILSLMAGGEELVAVQAELETAISGPASQQA
jgi:simple sugar transport system ATP-binding protein